MKTLVLILLGFFLGFLFTIIIIFATEGDVFYYIGRWQDNLNKSRSGVVYIVRKSHTDLYLKEDYSYSKLGEGLAPLLFYSVDSARQVMELLEWENSNWSVIETSKDILSDVVRWSRSEKPTPDSEKPRKENFHKFKIDDRLSINENREANGIEPIITRRCCNCDQSELRGDGMYCFEHSCFMSINGSCSYWEGVNNDVSRKGGDN